VSSAVTGLTAFELVPVLIVFDPFFARIEVCIAPSFPTIPGSEISRSFTVEKWMIETARLLAVNYGVIAVLALGTCGQVGD